jgi:hypothetical protein
MAASSVKTAILWRERRLNSVFEWKKKMRFNDYSALDVWRAPRSTPRAQKRTNYDNSFC